ncbi:hypothetical protein WKH56_20480 [Priestia sp. SB1]|uniref:hypothetical protein n=1 Tax=Priestia sp. SB1 TaxID=3132359 RepID=UPI003178261A
MAMTKGQLNELNKKLIEEHERKINHFQTFVEIMELENNAMNRAVVLELGSTVFNLEMEVAKLKAEVY